MTAQSLDPSSEREDIAIVGMAGRFPGADSVDALWRLLCEGREGLTRFGRDDLRAAGLPAEVTERPDYVAVNGRLDGIVSIGDVVKQRMEEVVREAEEMKSYIATA